MKTNPIPYVAGGTLQPDRDLYIVRQADEELLTRCQAGEFIYLLAARQIGKSSLMIRTSRRLEESGVRTVIIDLSLIGTDENVEQWYYSILNLIARKLRLLPQFRQAWTQQSGLTFTQRFVHFLTEVALPAAETPLIIFIDEIDTTIHLPFSDDFFAAVRALYNERTENPLLEKLSFVVIGMATPNELIADPTRTPFNIGSRLELGDFTAEEAAPLAAGLGDERVDGAQVLRWVLEHTGGHPYLTQRVCIELARRATLIHSAAAVAETVDSIFFNANQDENINLATIRNYIAHRLSPEERTAALSSYRWIRLGWWPVHEDHRSQGHAHLKLVGLVKRVANLLKVRNRIYTRAFDRRWINRHLPWRSWLRQMPPEFIIVLGLTIVLAVCLLATSGLVWRQATIADSRRIEAEFETRRARSGELAAMAQNELSLLENDSSLALMLAEKAVRTTWDKDQYVLPVADSVLRTAIANAQQNGWQMTLPIDQHTDSIRAMQYSPDGTQLVTASRDAYAIIWDVKSMHPLFQLAGHTEQLLSVTYSPNGTYIATASADQTVRIWNTRTGTTDQILRGHTGPVTTVDFRSDSKQIVTGGIDGTLRTWDVETGKLITIFKAVTPYIRQAIYSPDGTQIATITDKLIYLWDTSSQKIKGVLYGHNEKISLLTYGSNKETLVSSDGYSIRIWDTNTYTQLRMIETEEYERRGKSEKEVVFGIHHSNHGNYFISKQVDFGPTRITIRDIDTNKVIGNYLLKGTWGDTAAFSPDNRYVAIATTEHIYPDKVSGPSTVQILDIESGQLVGQLPGHTVGITALAYNQQTQQLISGDQKGNLIVWNADSGEQIGIADTLFNEILDIDVIEDGTGFTGITSRNTILFADSSGSPYGIEEELISLLAYRTHGSGYALERADHDLKLLKNKKLFTLIHDSDIDITSLVFSSDDKYLASGDLNGMIQIWDTDTLPFTDPLAIVAHTGTINALSFSPDSKYLVSGGDDAEIHIWDVETGSLIRTLHGHTDKVTSISHSPSNNLIVSGSADKSIRLWNASEGSLIRILEGHTDEVTAVVFIDGGERIVSGSKDSTIRFWATDSHPIANQLQGCTRDIMLAAFSPDGQSILGFKTDETIRKWSVKTGEQLLPVDDSSRCTSVTHRLDNTNIEVEILYRHAYNQQINAIAYAPYIENHFFDEYNKNLIYVRDLATNELIQELEGPQNDISMIAFSLDGTYVANLSRDEGLQIWNIRDKDEVLQIDTSISNTYFIRFSPDGKQIFFNIRGGLFEMDLATGDVVRTFAGHEDGILTAAISANGKLIASGSFDGTIYIWDRETSDAMYILEGHQDAVTDIAFSTDDAHIVSASNDQTIRLWDLKNGSLERTFLGHTAEVSSIRYSPDGEYLLSTSADNTIRLWKINDVNELLELATNLIQRTPPKFTANERIRFSVENE